LRSAALTVIDATEDPARASDAFLQSINVLGAESVAVYTEKMYADLELLVRILGTPLFLGPMTSEEWENYLNHKFPSLIPFRSIEVPSIQAEKEQARENGEDANDKIVSFRLYAG
jgi:hypothetical protein